MGIKPTIEVVLKYAEPIIMKFISQHAADLPREHKEEIQQTARLRIFQVYAGLDADAGWKSYVYNHARGAVLDYVKFGVGFQETKWSIAKKEDHDSRHVYKIRERMQPCGEDGQMLELDHILGAGGVFSEIEIDKMQIRWDLVERMASIDPPLHAMARHILGFAIEEMAPGFDLKRARVGQLIQAFVERFDDPEWAENPWFLQTCYAFNICEFLGLPDIDQATVPGNGRCGWELNPIDLEAPPEPTKKLKQLDLFDKEG